MFEQWRQRLAGEVGKTRKEPVLVEPLQPDEVATLNVGWNSHFNTPNLRQYVQQFPGLAWRVAGTTDYIVGDQWRRREDIGQITEARSRSHRAELVETLLAQYTRVGCRAVVVGSDEQNDNSKFYLEAGFEELECIVYYEKPDMHLNYQHPGPLPLLRPLQPTQANMAELLEVDHASFTWLWWNSRAELDFYRQQEGVTIYLAYLPEADGSPRPVGYFGFTLYERWAHLDRLAVVPGLQGRGVGAFQLAEAIKMMSARGTRRVTLSTQENNLKSQRLYEGFGFQRVKSLEYSLIGKWLGEK